ncbi:MAG TPA: orotidine-5'-phosphate decarboxylase [Chitinophagaceae bacterium]|nr:orotidine-5'-phosphate decarboxylase [Chitinophagaceae bacterium]
MTRKQLIDEIRKKQSYLCIGLDTDITKIPKHLLLESDPVFAFNKSIIDATRDLCVAYKINTAFYEALGVSGWQALEKTANYIGNDHFKIADAKRGDIGNTSDQYAKAFFETLPFDSVTVAPYMGEDSVKPFLQHDGKWAIVLGLTSNSGAVDFELEPTFVKGHAHTNESNDASIKSLNPFELLYEKVLRKVSTWGNINNLMFVIGATNTSYFEEVRRIVPDHFLLVPGVGAQGGSLKDISERAMNKDCGLLVNISRAVIYASAEEDFAMKARNAAKVYQNEMKKYLSS